LTDGIKIEVKGVKELQAVLGKLAVEIPLIVSDAVKDGGNIVKADAKKRVHVVTGNLRDSIDILHQNNSGSKTEVQVGTDVPYAAKEEFRTGGKYPGSHAYLRPALDTNEEAIKAAIENKIASALSRYR
jgi:HK97 gp10 family phage protein